MELWDLYDQDEKPLGQAHPRGTPLPPNTFHIIAHIWVLNRDNKFLIQKRSPTVEVYPNYWATTGGSIVAGESSLEGAQRELAEEIGLELDKQQFELLFKYRLKNRFAHVYLCRSHCNISDLTLDPQEVAEVCWMDIDQIRALLANGTMFNYGNEYLEKLGRVI